jgi:hypothetical protein
MARISRASTAPPTSIAVLLKVAAGAAAGCGAVAGFAFRSTTGGGRVEVGAAAGGAGVEAGAAAGAGAGAVACVVKCVGALRGAGRGAVRDVATCVVCLTVLVAVVLAAGAAVVVSVVAGAAVLVSVAGGAVWTGAGCVVAAGGVSVVTGCVCWARTGVEDSARAATIAGRALARACMIVFLIMRKNLRTAVALRSYRLLEA